MAVFLNDILTEIVSKWNIKS